MTKASNENGVHAKRGTKAINESLNKRLAVYALAAGAAGVGVLALAPAAQAGIIMGTGTPITIGVNTNEFLKINGKSVLSFADFNDTHSANLIDGTLVAKGLNGAGLLSGPLAKGAAIGTGGAFFTPRALAFNSVLVISGRVNSFVGGAWANKSGYLGFKFESNAKSYFGWAHLKVTANPKNGETGLISEFAYEACPNVAIGAGVTSGGPTCAPTVTPEPNSLTLYLLGLGAVGLVELRRHRAAPAASGS